MLKLVRLWMWKLMALPRNGTFATVVKRKKILVHLTTVSHKEVSTFPYGEDFAMARLSEVLQLNLLYEMAIQSSAQEL